LAKDEQNLNNHRKHITKLSQQFSIQPQVNRCLQFQQGFKIDDISFSNNDIYISVIGKRPKDQ